VRTGSQEATELAVVEDQAHFVSSNLDVLEQHQGCTSFSIHSATLALSVLLNSLKEAVGRRDVRRSHRENAECRLSTVALAGCGLPRTASLY